MARYIKDYSLEITLTNYVYMVVDIELFMSTEKNQMVSDFLNKESFKDFEISYGDLEWGNDLHLSGEEICAWANVKPASPEKTQRQEIGTAIYKLFHDKTLNAIKRASLKGRIGRMVNDAMTDSVSYEVDGKTITKNEKFTYSEDLKEYAIKSGDWAKTL